MNTIDHSVRVGIVGFGDFGRQYAATLNCLSEASLAAIVELNAEKLQDARSQFPNATCTDNVDAIVADASVDAWIVASTTASHVGVARTCLAAGKHALVEKPLAARLEDALSLEPLARENPGRLMMGHVVLFNSEFQQLMQECDGRSPLRFIDAVRHRPAATIEAYPGESPFELTMVHDLYCVLALLQRAEPCHFAAQVRRRADAACDLAMAQLGFSSGCCVSLTASFLTPQGMPPDGFDRMEVFGEGWAARVLANPRPLEIWDDRSRHPLTLELGSHHRSGMLAEQVRCFCRVVRGQEAVPTGASYDDAIQIQRWIERLEETATEIC